MRMRDCVQCLALQSRLNDVAIEYLCATQQLGTDREIVRTKREDLDEAEARLNQHLAMHAISARVVSPRLIQRVSGNYLPPGH